ncbi:hypothetical protein QYE76_008064 [Lolium multiflorum]|uniref:Uncharacterized protein n=1 Tax=Lolium multiflorum TaxID=4521 RepID=A0AAD8VCN9_LOLMU|nr:hypothetical protein QYE76_008064 [Lolium multiflorum]
MALTVRLAGQCFDLANGEVKLLTLHKLEAYDGVIRLAREHLGLSAALLRANVPLLRPFFSFVLATPKWCVPGDGVAGKDAEQRSDASTEENSSEGAQSSPRDSSPGDTERSTTQSQTDSPTSASQKRSTPEPTVLQTDGISSGDVEEVPMPSAALGLSNSPSVTDQVANLAQTTAKPIVTTSASLPFLGEGCDPSSLLTFDPDSIEPAVSKAGEEPDPSAVDGPLQRLKVLLSSSVDTLVENPEAIKGILEDIQPRLPVTLQVKLWPAVFLSVFRSRVQSARQRITLRRAQLPLRADIAGKCQRLNEKKAALDAKTATSTRSVKLETLRKELETRQLIQDEESLLARSQEEAQGLTADLKTDLAEIRALSS